MERRGEGVAARPSPCQGEGAASVAAGLGCAGLPSSGIFAVAAQRALSATLAGLPGAGLDALDGTAPPWPEVLAAARLGKAEEASRLPLRAG